MRRRPARLLLCAALLLGVTPACGDDEKKSSDSGGPAAEEPPPSVAKSSAWQAGSWWLYRVTRVAAEGKVDESAHLDFFLLREVKSVQQNDDGSLMVTVRESGGIAKARTRKWTVDDTCVKGKDPIYCRPEGKPSAVKVGELDFNVGRHETEAHTAAFDQDVGIVEETSVDRDGRTTTMTLAGYVAGERKGGQERTEPVECDWARETGHGNKLSKRSDPDGSHAARATAAGIQGDVRRTVLPVGGDHGAKSVEVLYGDQMSQLTVFAEDGKGVLHSHSSAGKLGKVKVWTSPSKDFQLVAATLEHAESSTVELLRITQGKIERKSYTLPSVAAKTDKLAVHLIADPKSCLVRVRHQTKEAVKVADLAAATPAYEKVRGTLELPE